MWPTPAVLTQMCYTVITRQIVTTCHCRHVRRSPTKIAYIMVLSFMDIGGNIGLTYFGLNFSVHGLLNVNTVKLSFCL